MAKQRTSFAKLQRERAKAAKKAAKQASRQGRDVDPSSPAGAMGGGEVAVEVEDHEPEFEEGSIIAQMFEGKGELSAPELLEMVEQVHKKREAGLITADEFEEAKVEIFARLPMD
ncbi:MAG: hypothetical protein HKN26_04680 [Acidimicrobiales bacterium]|nr:hypothetical protein [Acidimicrobiales bacterium]